MEFKIFAKDYIRNLTNLLNFIDLDEYEKFFNTILSIENDSTIYVLGNGAQYLAELFLTGVLGWDDDEAEDLFKNAKKYANQK